MIDRINKYNIQRILLSPIINLAVIYMIIKSKRKLPILASDKEDKFPILPLRTGVLFPGATLTIQVGRKENLALLNHCRSGIKKFVAAHTPHHRSRDDVVSFHQVGTLAVVRDVRPGPGNSEVATIEGLERVVISEVLKT